jgi:hypothetical protein
MKDLEDQERMDFAPHYDPADVDAEFIPYLDRINAKPFAATVQCCIGHCEYRDTTLMRATGSGRWGYLELLMTGPSATWLSQEVRGRDWLIEGLSKMWSDKPAELPSYTEGCNFLIAFAWDASCWPTAAEEICALLDQYHEAVPEEPSELVAFELPRGIARSACDHLKRESLSIQTLV